MLAALPRPLRATTLTDLDTWASALPGARTTVARRIASAKSLFSFADRTGYLPVNVGAALRTPSVPKDVTDRILTEEQMIRMLASPRKARDRVLLRFLYSSGARISEALGLTWRDVRETPQGPVARLHCKGDRIRHVVISQATAAALQALRPGDAGDEAPVFIGNKGRALTARAALNVVRAAARSIGITDDVSPHWLRHCNASHSPDRGCPVHVLQSSLGHASIATTSRYLHAKPADGSARYLAV